MTFNRRELGEDERDRLEEILTGSLDACNEDDKAATVVALRKLAAESGMWVATLRDQAFKRSVQIELKNLAKSRHKIIVPWNGASVVKTQMRAVTRRDTETGKSSQQQSLISVMTWDEFNEWAATVFIGLTSWKVNATIATKVAHLRDLYPESKSVPEALKLHGTSLDEYLGEAGAA